MSSARTRWDIVALALAAGGFAGSGSVLLGSIGWRGFWFFNAGLLLLFVLVFAQATAPSRWQVPAAADNSLDGAGVRATLARPGPWLFGVCFVLFSIQWLALMTWLPTFLIETQGRSLAGASLLTALIVSVTALGAIAGASLMHRGAVRWLRHEGRPFAGAPALVHEYGTTFRGSRPD